MVLSYFSKASVILKGITLVGFILFSITLQSQNFEFIKIPIPAFPDTIERFSVGCSWAWESDTSSYLFFNSELDQDKPADDLLYRITVSGSITRIFVDSITSVNFQSNSSTWGDFDNDGDWDFVITNEESDLSSRFFRNNRGVFEFVSNSVLTSNPQISRGCSWGDFNCDGYLDLLVANGDPMKNHLYQNNFGTLVLLPDTLGAITSDNLESSSCTWVDYNNDRNPDGFVLNQHQNILYKNEGSFQNIFQVDSVENAGCSWADYNNDCYLDVFITRKKRKDAVYRNDSIGFTLIDSMFESFSPDSCPSNCIETKGSTWGDFDNDGDLDLFITNPVSFERNLVYENLGDSGNYELVKIDNMHPILGGLIDSSNASYAVSSGDYNKDGFLDLLIANNNQQPNQIIKNNLKGTLSNHFLSIRCIGTCSNRSAIGTKIKIKANIGGNVIWQMREISSQTGFASQNSPEAHFGLGDATQIDSLVIEWPSEINQYMTGIGVDTFLTIIELGGNAPDISSLSISTITSCTAFIDGTINSNGIWTTAYMEWGTDSTYPNRTSIFKVGVKITDDSTVRIPLSNLSPNTTYYLRWVVINSQDTAIQTQSFSTPPDSSSGLFSLANSGDISTYKGRSSSGIWVDMDEDHYLDFFLANEEENNLYLNSGPPDYILDWAPANHLTSDPGTSVAAFPGDHDNDGLVDLFLLNSLPEEGEKNILYLNQSPTSSVRIMVVQTDDTTRSYGGSWADYDKDGLLDLFVSDAAPNSRNHLYKNLGDSVFVDVDTFPYNQLPFVTTSFGVNWVDFDNDQDLDLYVSNGGNLKSEPNFLFENRDGNFEPFLNDVIVQESGFSQAGSWGDYDNDGDLDLFVADGHSDFPSTLYRNELVPSGLISFTKMDTEPFNSDKADSQSASWVDYDLDGDLDLFVVNRDEPDNFLYLNSGPTGNYQFLKETCESIVKLDEKAVGSSWGDFDNDGDLDLFIATSDSSSTNYLFRNEARALSGNRWVNIELEGRYSNRSAIGSRIKIKATINGVPTWQMREIAGQSGHLSHNSLRASFGLGDATQIDSMIIHWPSGIVWDTTNVETNRFLIIVEPTIPFDLEFISITAPECINLDNDSSINILAEVNESAVVKNMILHYRPFSDIVWTQVNQNNSASKLTFR